MRKSYVLGCLALVGVVSLSELARAAPRGRAEALFDEGVAQLEAGHFDVACPALDESYTLEPQLGTLLAAADCFDRWGKLPVAAERYEQFLATVAQLDAAEQAYREPQAQFAREAQKRLQRQLEAAPAEPKQGSVTKAPAPARPRFEPSVTAGPISAAPMAAAPDVRDNESPADPWRSLGWGLGGLGLVGVGVGAVATVLVLEECPGFDCGPKDGRGDEQALALVADIGFGVGLASLAASAILLLQTSPPNATASGWQPVAVVSPNLALLGMRQPW